MSKTGWALLEKKGWTHKQHSLIDYYTWTHQCGLSNKNLYSSILRAGWVCCPNNWPRVMANRDGWRQRVKGTSAYRVRRDEFIPFTRGLTQSKTHIAQSKIWAWVKDSISYDNNHYTKPTYFMYYVYLDWNSKFDIFYWPFWSNDH